MVPVFSTDRLLLRRIVPTDITRVYEGLSNPEVIRHYGVWYHSLESTQAQMDWYAKQENEDTGRFWAITIKQEPHHLIGVIGLYNWVKKHRRIELGNWLLPQYQRKGIMSEGLAPVFDYVYNQLDINRIEAIIESGNHASIKLMKKLKFVHEGTMRQAEIKNGHFIDLIMYARLKGDTAEDIPAIS
jgi:ribosomal-protein-alanine N-acetyltransferase